MRIKFESNHDKAIFEFIEFSITRYRLFGNKSIILSFYLFGYGLEIEFDKEE